MSPRLALVLLLNFTLSAAGLAAALTAVFPRWGERPRVRRALRVGVGAVVVAVSTLELAARRFAPLGGGAWRPVLTLERTALIAGAFVGLGAVLGRVLAGVVPQRAAETPGEGLSRREAVVRGVTVTAAGIAAPAVILGATRVRHDIEVTELTVTVDGLPPALEGLTLVHLTDLHVGIFTGRAELLRLAEIVRRLDADHLVITGDILDNSPRHIAEGMDLLGRLHARRGRFAALGNHDHYTGPRRVYDGLRRVGITPLVNASVVLDGGGREGIVLAGLDDLMAPRLGSGRGPDLRGALRGRDAQAPRVVLAHNPLCFDLPGADRAALQLSGHTHGGQINPGGATGALLRYVGGRYVRGASVLYVSRGLGITGPPVRLGARPEVVRVALTARRRPAGA
jgi:predicted MPP superfamily phosphohydrolase